MRVSICGSDRGVLYVRRGGSSSCGVIVERGVVVIFVFAEQ